MFIDLLVFSPEELAGITASLHNQLQRSINILFAAVLATIGLTIPAVLMLLTPAVCVVTFTSRKTNVSQGCIHLLLLTVFVLLIFVH